MPVKTISLILFIVLPIDILPQCLMSDNYDDTEGWTTVGSNVEIRDGKLRYIEGAWDSSQRRVYKKLETQLDNHCTWTIDVEFTPLEFGELNGLPWVGHGILMLTESNGEPLTDCQNVQCSERPPSDQQCLGVMYETPNPPSGVVYFNALAREGGNEYRSDSIVADSLNKKYYLRFQRLDFRLVQLSVFDDSARTNHVTGSPVYFIIPGSVSDLKYIQHANAARGDFRRRLTANMDNLCIRWDDDCIRDSSDKKEDPPIDSISCHLQLFTPNSFTPNGDGINDIFQPLIDGYLSRYELHIYNRWGDEVYTTYHSKAGWDGLIDGQPAPVGTFVYQWTAELDSLGCTVEKQDLGRLTLLR